MDTMDGTDGMQARIVEVLRAVEVEHGVRVVWAIESGSRSWGFDSPDSDYDVRFIYVHRPEWYLTIEEGRDVIELPVDAVLDVSGWDVRKALRLFYKSNPVLIEWLVSPFVYLRQGPFRDRLLEIAAECFSLRACSYHYLRMAENNYRRYIQPREAVNLKKYFYVLRPLLNILWLSQKKSIPPMEFTEALRQMELPGTVLEAIETLLEEKKVTSEMGKGPKIDVLESFIQDRLGWAQGYCESAPVGGIDMERLNRLFRETIEESWDEEKKQGDETR